jgi:protein-S-isoprenylcysteine O-methyltransferase Ste14/uncharacterized membrane protein (UPF0127 family)
VSIVNETRNSTLIYSVTGALDPLTRLTGLLGTFPPDSRRALYILPCTGVHTFGMDYPLDVIFLDGDGRVVKVIRNLPPNRVTGIVPSAGSALEFPAGVLGEGEVRIGDRLRVEVDEKSRLEWKAFGTLLHWPLNFAAAALWFMFVYAYYLEWRQTGQVFILGLIAVNAVMAILFLTRRKSTDTSNRIPDWLVAFGVVGLSKLLGPRPGPDSAFGVVAISVQVAGAAFLLGSLLSLGRSFGLVAANRGIKTAGLYRIVRHPAYASELILYLGLLLENLSARSAGFVILIAAGQVYRLFAEERVLKRNNRYRDYMRSTRHRLIPGIF